MNPPRIQAAPRLLRVINSPQAATDDTTEAHRRVQRGAVRALSRPQRTPPRKLSTRADQLSSAVSDPWATVSGP